MHLCGKEKQQGMQKHGKGAAQGTTRKGAERYAGARDEGAADTLMVW